MNATQPSDGDEQSSLQPSVTSAEPSLGKFSDLRTLLVITIVAGLYFGAASLGLSLAYIHANVSPVWPPTGVAIAAVVLFGHRIWPAIILGAFLANLLTPISVATAGGIAMGNTLEALSAGYLLRFLGFHSSFEQAKDVLKFVVAAILCTMLSATIGNLSLCLSHAASWENFGNLWLTWWLGDTIGALLIAPLLLTWGSGSRHWLPRKRYLEGLLVLVLLAVAAMATFGGPSQVPLKFYPIVRLTVPFFLWAAFRLGQRGVTLAILTVSVFAVWGTAQGSGPFVDRTPNESLLILQLFLGSNAVTFLFLVAAVEERRHSEETVRESERRLAVNLAVTRILAESPAVNIATPRILQTISDKLGWQMGDMWTPNASTGELHCNAVWRAPTTKLSQFETVSRELTFTKGVGLPGRVWANLEPAWIPDVTRDPNFPRAQAAVADGLHSAFAFPILAGEKFLGVMEFFCTETLEGDDSLLQMFGGIGSQIGQFIERRRAEESLVESQEALRLAHKVARGGTWQWDLVTDGVEWSNEYYDLLGLNRAEVPSPLAEWSSRIHPHDLANVLKEHELAIASKRDVDIEFRIRRADGEWRWFNRTARCIYGPDGKPTVMIGITFDVTERKRAAEERERLLERERAALAEAELANRTKDEFLATVSHELRTPLTAIVGWTDMLQAGKLDDVTANEAIAVINRNAKAQARLINDLLDVARVVSGKLRLDLRPVHLPPVIEAAVNSLRPMFEAKNIHLQVLCDTGAKQVSGDASRLEQIVWNLLSNAVKFTPAEGDITLRLIDAESHVEILVSDTGQGITAEFLPHVFDRFRQANASKTREGGLGLGLAIVRHLVELHGGSIEAASAGEGKGATFRVRFACIGLERAASLGQNSDVPR